MQKQMNLRLITLSERNNSKKCKLIQRQAADQLMPEDREMGRIEEEITKADEGFLQVMDLFTISIVAAVSWVYSDALF